VLAVIEIPFRKFIFSLFIISHNVIPSLQLIKYALYGVYENLIVIRFHGLRMGKKPGTYTVVSYRRTYPKPKNTQKEIIISFSSTSLPIAFQPILHHGTVDRCDHI
jgi:hypothetical protein